MERAMPRTIVEVLPDGAEVSWTEGDAAGPTRALPGPESRVVEVLPDGRRRFVEVMPSGAELSWIEGGGSDDDAEAA